MTNESYEILIKTKKDYRKMFGEIEYGTEEFQWSPEQYIAELQRCIDTGKSLVDYYGEPDYSCLY